MLPSIHHYKPKIHKERIDVTSQNSIKSSKRRSSAVLENTMIHKREEMPHWESGKSAQKTMKTPPLFSNFIFLYSVTVSGGNWSWWGATEAADGDESQLTASNGAEQRCFSCLVSRRRGNISVSKLPWSGKTTEIGAQQEAVLIEGNSTQIAFTWTLVETTIFLSDLRNVFILKHDFKHKISIRRRWNRNTNGIHSVQRYIIQLDK